MAVQSPSLGRRSALWAIAVAIEATAIFWASSQPSPALTSSELLDLVLKKSGHLAVFALLAASAWLAVRDWLRPIAATLAAFVLATAYAVIDETHQVFTATRQPSPADVAIDAAGAVLGIAAASWLVRRRTRRGR